MSIKKKSHTAGVTLFEVILVLTVMAGILYFSISQYMVFQRDADVIRVQTNVDLLYDAMVKYFRASCNDPKDSLFTYYNAQYLPMDLTYLIKSHYLVLENGTIPMSPIVSKKNGNNAYILQFNQIQNPSAPPLLPQRTILSASGTTNVGSIVLWQIQVAVELNDPKNATLYKNLLGADCISDQTKGGGIVTPCDKAGTKATQYAVWSRLPSFASSQANSTYWASKPKVRQFSQMYSTSPILSLTNNLLTDGQYYTCGGG